MHRDGKIVIPNGLKPWPHEMRCARSLSAAGRNIEFVRPISGDRVRSADLVMGGVLWEVKSPETTTVKSLQRILRRACRQSPNIILDTARMTRLSDSAVERELRRLKPLIKSIRRLILVTKSGDVVDIP